MRRRLAGWGDGHEEPRVEPLRLKLRRDPPRERGQVVRVDADTRLLEQLARGGDVMGNRLSR